MDQFQTLEKLVKENQFLKNELLTALNEKEELINVCKTVMQDKEKIERRYKNLRASKLGRITVWYWERKRKAK